MSGGLEGQPFIQLPKFASHVKQHNMHAHIHTHNAACNKRIQYVAIYAKMSNLQMRGILKKGSPQTGGIWIQHKHVKAHCRSLEIPKPNKDLAHFHIKC